MRMKWRIKELRARYDLTQEQLAEKVGLSRQTLVAIENGSKDPRISTVMKIAKVFGCAVDDLFFCADSLPKLDN